MDRLFPSQSCPPFRSSLLLLASLIVDIRETPKQYYLQHNYRVSKHHPLLTKKVALEIHYGAAQAFGKEGLSPHIQETKGCCASQTEDIFVVGGVLSGVSMVTVRIKVWGQTISRCLQLTLTSIWIEDELNILETLRFYFFHL